MSFTRREILAAPVAAAWQSAGFVPDSELVRRHDESVDQLLQRQETDASSRYRGGFRDDEGLWHPGSAAGFFDAALAAYVCPQSRHHRSAELLARAELAAAHLRNRQHADGTIDLLITNFHSTPDLGFAIHSAGNGALLARRFQVGAAWRAIEPFLRKAGDALAVGGVHTPNHRWVVCEALAQLQELMPDPRFVQRIDQWLAEGIDIDEDGQYNERSTTIYNAATDNALTVVAAKLNRPELLEPVRRNLDSMLYLLHPGFEVVTEISRRQDLNTRGDMSRYWFSLRYLAALEGNGRYRSVLDAIEPRAASLSQLLAWPELQKPLPAPVALPSDYERVFKASAVARIRRGDRSATLALEGNSRFFSLRHGECAVQAVRFASAFFGKGQFRAQTFERTPQGWLLTQRLEGPYYQPLDPPRKVAADDWGSVRAARRQSEVMKLTQTALIRETQRGFALELASSGTDEVPLSVEISLRPGGMLQGAQADTRIAGTYVLASGHATYTAAGRGLRFGPGLGEHRYTQVRGAEPRVSGLSVYLCANTPFRHTLEFECL